mmetsp:Transcript_33214/g.86974  ORF Transcript_33214/g.86974 Transcript_33214/m.86974 type:complete len:235 (+) Transcript_33214:1743-2447(+)
MQFDEAGPQSSRVPRKGTVVAVPSTTRCALTPSVRRVTLCSPPSFKSAATVNLCWTPTAACVAHSTSTPPLTTRSPRWRKPTMSVLAKRYPCAPGTLLNRILMEKCGSVKSGAVPNSTGSQHGASGSQGTERSCVGKRVGRRVGTAVGALVGEAVVGSAVGDAEGLTVGTAVGSADGAGVGSNDGAALGVALGAAVGTAVGYPLPRHVVHVPVTEVDKLHKAHGAHADTVSEGK